MSLFPLRMQGSEQSISQAFQPLSATPIILTIQWLLYKRPVFSIRKRKCRHNTAYRFCNLIFYQRRVLTWHIVLVGPALYFLYVDRRRKGQYNFHIITREDMKLQSEIILAVISGILALGIILLTARLCHYKNSCGLFIK